MREIILVIAEAVNTIHDLLIDVFGVYMTDKELHFWIFGFIGIITYFFVYVCFKLFEHMKGRTAILSFIYTFTVMVVLVFAIELQQAITNRGNMEFADAMAGLWGFLAFFLGSSMIVLLFWLLSKLFRK
ncbi:hypothetical protein ACFOGI_00595 [Virgibacillus xinjiangensis]|uniref:Uncharacterized protein n=1 Tax=Virgibacillus xinjiangensis TaxID=393090 RepID=A0ABV7CQU1_9BACI